MEKTSEKELDFLIALLQKVKSTAESQEQALIERLWIQIFQYSSGKVKQEVKLDLLSKIDINVQDLKSYLKIDVPILVDYSFIENEDIRNQLYIDCLEMAKYRYGKIGDKKNFEEYCRYTVMQVEMLVNYLLTRKFSNINDIISFIQKYNTRYEIVGKSPIDIDSIHLKTKIISINKYLEISTKSNNVLGSAIEIRNGISHRGTKKLGEEDRLVNKYFEYGIDKMQLTDVFKDPFLSKIYNDSKHIILKRDEEWILVEKALGEYVKKIAEDLKIAEVELKKNN
jgi:hypothetical protein